MYKPTWLLNKYVSPCTNFLSYSFFDRFKDLILIIQFEQLHQYLFYFPHYYVFVKQINTKIKKGKNKRDKYQLTHKKRYIKIKLCLTIHETCQYNIEKSSSMLLL